MSDNTEENKENNALQEVSKTVAISAEDCHGASEFWKHFSVEITPELKAAFAKFEGDPTYENQQEVRLQVCRAIGYTDHDAFKDDMFKEITEECRNISYDMSFDESLEATLGTEEDRAKQQS